MNCIYIVQYEPILLNTTFGPTGPAGADLRGLGLSRVVSLCVGVACNGSRTVPTVSFLGDAVHIAMICKIGYLDIFNIHVQFRSNV